MSTGALAAFRQGQMSTGERLIAEIDRLHTPDGALPGQTRAWATAQYAVFNGHPEQGAQIFWDAAVSLWGRGARFSALSCFLSALEIAPSKDRLEQVQQLLDNSDVPVIFQAQAEYYAAAYAEDMEQTMRAADRLNSLGRIGLAMRAYQTVISLGERQSASAVADRAASRLAEIRQQHASRRIDVSRFSINAVTLTDREREVAELAAEGLSNQEIANQLVLSVRTVETHLHRVMRKLDVSSRREIGAALSDVY